MARNITLIQLPMSVLKALADGDIVAANLGSSIEFKPYFVGPECRGTWQRRASQVAEDPNTAAWITRAILEVDRLGTKWTAKTDSKSCMKLLRVQHHSTARGDFRLHRQSSSLRRINSETHHIADSGILATRKEEN